jgi:chromosome partitioning protein
MTYIISVANEKGGVAKTTTAVSLGAAIVEAGLEVLLIDLDGQANLSLALGSDTGKTKSSVVNVLLENLPARSAIQETGIPRLSLLPATAELSLAERFLPIRPGYEMTLAKAIQEANQDFDYIILDCPPFLGAVTTNALMASNLLLMPSQAEYFSINALRNMMGMVRRARGQGNPHLTYRLLLTMFDRRNRIHRTLSEQLRTTFGNGVLETVIEIDTKLRESPIAGLPIIFHAPKSRAAVQYRALAQEILTYVKETTAQQAA